MRVNKNMTSELEQQLKQGGQTIKQQAHSRLDQWGVSESMIQAIGGDAVNRAKSKSWWYGMAAVISFTALVWAATFTDSIQTAQLNHNPLTAIQPIGLKLKQLPLSLEQKINQPLINEQQAIIADLKALKVQLLSI